MKILIIVVLLLVLTQQSQIPEAHISTSPSFINKVIKQAGPSIEQVIDNYNISDIAFDDKVQGIHVKVDLKNISKNISIDWDGNIVQDSSEYKMQIHSKNINATLQSKIQFQIGIGIKQKGQIIIKISSLSTITQLQFTAQSCPGLGFGALINAVTVNVSQWNITIENKTIDNLVIKAIKSLLKSRLPQIIQNIAIKQFNPLINDTLCTPITQLQQIGKSIYVLTFNTTAVPKFQKHILNVPVDIVIKNLLTNQTNNEIQNENLPTDHLYQDKADLTVTLSSNMINTLTWLIQDSNMLQITITNDDLGPKPPIALITNNLTILMPGMSKWDHKEVFLQISRSCDLAHIYIRNGRLLGSISLSINFIINLKQSTKNISECIQNNNCISAIDLNITIQFSIGIYIDNINILQGIIQNIQILQVNVKQLQYRQQKIQYKQIQIILNIYQILLQQIIIINQILYFNKVYKLLYHNYQKIQLILMESILIFIKIMLHLELLLISDSILHRNIQSILFQILQTTFYMQYTNAYQKQGYIITKPPPYTSMPNRTIITNVPDQKVCTNQIKTCKYTIITFLPLNLIVQFSKIPNIYFLIVGIMQMIPQISISNGFPVIFVPLSIVVGVSMFKDFYEDDKRKNSDNQINNKVAYRLGSRGYQATLWSGLKIGDVIRVNKNDEFPADIILLQSSEEKHGCFIETKNLDGQTNLKFKQVKSGLGNQLKHYVNEQSHQLYKLRKLFKYERPNPFIHTFTGSYDDIPLDNNNVVLRGCYLRITEWVSGVIIYTGVDSKIMLNSNKSRQKKSRLQFKMGITVVVVFLGQMLITLFSALVSMAGNQDKWIQRIQWVYPTFWLQLVRRWGSWVLLFTNFVPISLIVSLEMVKYIQGQFISQANYSSANQVQVKVQTSTLNQELGQIQHLFSDKTGTLTKNYMSFRHLVAGCKIYLGSNEQSSQPCIEHVQFRNEQFLENIRNQMYKSNSMEYQMIMSFALCHNVIIEDKDGERSYNASSPDQLAFINMAKHCGWIYQGLDADNYIIVTTPKTQIKFKLLHIVEFDSDRKRMSVIVEKNDCICVYTKGADNIIYDRLKDNNSLQVGTCKDMIEQWSKEGLRTLVFAKREIKKDDFAKWAKMYAYALSNLDRIAKQENQKIRRDLISHKVSSPHKRGRIPNHEGLGYLGGMVIEADMEGCEERPEDLVNKLLNDNSMLSQQQRKFIEIYIDQLNNSGTNCTAAQLEDMLEKQLQIIGATAIEDKLQDNVAITLKRIKKAGIKVWMLTGDKKETAINIGYSCGLVSKNMSVISWKQSLENTVKERNELTQQAQCCLVLTGNDLLSDIDQKSLLNLINSFRAIICCRVTPKQKQDMVWLMRKNRFTTLSIGDGANDVNMINTAHVGVGIKGVQGAQAALCSDYAISQFQILGDLLLYHGRQSYRKNANLVLFTFYKNLLLVMPQFWFGFNNQFSSATIYDPWIYQLYNVVFTSLPIIAYALFDQKNTLQQSLNCPQLYGQGLRNELFSLRKIIITFSSTMLYSLWLCYFTYQLLQQTIDSSGIKFTFISVGMCIFLQCVIICSLKVSLLSYNSSIGLNGCIFISILMYFLSCVLQELVIRNGEMTNILSIQLRSLLFWIVVICNTISVMIMEGILSKIITPLGCRESIFKDKTKQDIEIPLLDS